MEVGLRADTDSSFPTQPLDVAQDHANLRTQFRWFVCGLLFFATLINYIDRQILALLKETLDKDLSWTNAQYGLANSMFQIAYGISFIGFGWIIDRFGTKIGYAVSIAMWSIAAAAHAAVGSVSGFYAARLALGLGEAGNFPSAIKATAQWFPKRERAFATSIFNSGASVAAVLAPQLVPFIAFRWGWHATFIVAKFMTDPVWLFFLIWLPDFFKKTRGMDVKKSMWHLAAIYGIITVLSIFGGWLPGTL